MALCRDRIINAAIAVALLTAVIPLPFESKAQAPDSAYWPVDSAISLYHFETGTGRNVLVIHGGPGSPFAEPIPALDSLGERFRFVYYHQRGCGLSTRPIDRFASPDFAPNTGPLAAKLGFDQHLRDIDQIRQRLGDEQLILLGHSFGGFMATMYALEYPGRVAALILVSPADLLVFPPKEDLFVRVEHHLPDTLKPAFADFRARYLDFNNIFSQSDSALVALNCEFSRFFAAASRAAGAEISIEPDCALLGGWMVQAIYLTMGMAWDHRDKLWRIQVPTLVLHGSRDLQSQGVGRRYVDGIAGAEFEIVEGAGHFMFLTHPERFGDIVGDFLDQLE